MKLIRGIALCLILLAGISLAQNTTTTINVTDAGSVAWANGTYSITFVGPPSVIWTGGTLNTATPITGVLNGAGTAAVTIPDNNQITPPGTQWAINICSATLPRACASSTVTITGATQTVNITPAAIVATVPTSPTFSLNPLTMYADAEISGGWVGYRYYNVASGSLRVCQTVTANSCSAFAAVGGSGGGNVNSSGSPTVNQLAQWVDSTHIQGINPTLSSPTFAATSSVQLAGVVTDEIGSGKLVFATSLQGTDTKVLTAGTVSGTGATLCVDALGGATTSGCGTGVGTVTSVGQSFTGGLISVAGSPITTSGTLALTVAGTSGGIPYFSGASTWASSGALPTGNFVLGGGAGGAPTATFSIVPVSSGGTGTASPSLIAGTNITITGAWPNQTINAATTGSGTVTSVAQTVPSGFSVAGSPITTSGTLGITYSVAGMDQPLLSTGTNAAGFAAAIPLCGDGSHALSYSTSTHTFGCQALTTGGAGTVTSVAVTVPSGLAISGSPITTSGTLGITYSVAASDQILISTAANTASFAAALATCGDGTHAINYSASTHTFGCQTLTTGGAGTVTSFSAGTLSPLFTTSVATATTTPALTFILSSAAAGTVFGNATAAVASPIYTSTPVLGAAGVNVGSIGFQNLTSGTILLTPTTGALGSITITMPAVTGTMAETTGTLTSGHCSQFDGSGRLVDSGAGCGGSGTVTSVAETVPSGFAVSGSPITTSGTFGITYSVAASDQPLLSTAANTASFAAAIPLCGDGTHALSYSTSTHTFGCQTLTTGGAGTVTSVSQTFTGGLISVAGSPITTSGTLALTVAGTSGGIPYFSSATAWASSGLLPTGDFVLGGGAGGAPTATFSIVPVVNGGTGTASPGLIAGTNVTITGSWPNQTINSNAGAAVTWNAITNPTGNQALTFAATDTTTWTIADQGASPITGIFNITDTSSTATDTSTDLIIQAPSGSYHNPLTVAVAGFNQFQVCNTNGASHVGITVSGNIITCPNLSTAPVSKSWILVGSNPHTAQTLYENAAAYTGNLFQMHTFTASGTGFNFWTACPGASNTDGSCASGNVVAKLRGDGLLTSTSAAYTGSTSGVITTKPQAAAGTWEWDWPITAGTAGQVLTSQGGAGTAMTWTTAAGGGGTVTSIATTSPITGGTITTTGTIACATCVVASSPGAGIARFAGSTQTVTSAEISGDVTTSGSNVATVVQIEGAAIPVSANVVSTNASKQLVAGTSHAVSTVLSCVAASGSGTAYTCTTTPTFTPADNDTIHFESDVANTGAATLNVNSSSAAPIKKQGGGTALVANDFLAGQDTILIFDGVNWQMQGQVGNAASGTGNTTSTGLTSGVIPQASGVNSIVNSSPQLDNGVTTANTLTYAGTAGVTSPVFRTSGTNGGLSGLEGTGANVTGSGTCLATFDNLWADSTLHGFKMCAASNGTVTTAVPVVGGPASSTAGDVVTFNGVGGEFIQDSGILGTNIVRKDANNTGAAAMTLDMSASTGTGAFRIPNSAGATTVVNGALVYDTTNNNVHFGSNGVDNINAVIPTSVTVTNNDCAKWTVASGVITLNDAGAACGSGGGTVPINSVLSATGAIATIALGNNPLVFSCALTSGTSCMALTQATASTVSGSAQLQITSLTTSAAMSIQITQGANGPANGNAPAVLNVQSAMAGGLAGASNNGSVGAPITLLMGNGSAGGATTGNGGAGGGLTVTTGTGAAGGGNTANNGGAGGSMNFVTGGGGAAAATGTSGGGGFFTFTTGVGGTTGTTPGANGEFQITSTAPNSVSVATGISVGTLFLVSPVTGGATSNAAGTAGKGSIVNINAGNGGVGSGTNAVGGTGADIFMQAGTGGSSNGSGVNANGGSLIFTPGAPGTGGSGTAGLAGVFKVNGSNAGFIGLAQGTANTTLNTNIPANSIIIQAPTSVAAYAITLPGAVGSAGQFLQTNGSGVTSWAIGGGGGVVVYSGPSLTLTGTLFFPFSGGGASSGTETNVDVEASSAATITNFYVQLAAALGGGNTAVFTWRKNAADTSVTCTITGASATTCNDTTHSFTAAQGDLLDIQVVVTGTIAAATVVMDTQFGTTGSNGTVNSGTANQIAYYAGTGTAVSGNAATLTAGGNLTLAGNVTLSNNLLSALPTASASGNVAIAAVSNIVTVSENGTLNGMFYPLEARALRYRRQVTTNGGAAVGAIAGLTESQTTTCSTASGIAATATTSQMLACLTSITNGNPAQMAGSFNYIFPGTNIWFNGYGAVGTTATTRWWFGLTSAAIASLEASDTCSTFHCAAFAYSSTSAISAVNYRCVINGGGTGTQIDTDSGITATANVPHVFDIREDSTAGKWYFFIDGVSKCASPITTQLPTLGLKQLMAVTNNGSATTASQEDFGWTDIWTDH